LPPCAEPPLESEPPRGVLELPPRSKSAALAQAQVSNTVVNTKCGVANRKDIEPNL
jgi:hypothetical protein